MPSVQPSRLCSRRALQTHFNSANFSSIATDAKAYPDLNVGAERMLVYAAASVNKITPAASPIHRSHSACLGR